MQMSMVLITIMFLMLLVPFTKSVVSLGFLLFSVAMFMTVLVSFIMSSWFAFILFLVYITGLLVLFSYMMAMSPNIYYAQKSIIKLLVFLFYFVLLGFVVFSSPLVVLQPVKGSSNFEWEVVQLFSSDSIMMYWLVGLILLVALLMAVTICYKVAKPLRSYLF